MSKEKFQVLIWITPVLAVIGIVCFIHAYYTENTLSNIGGVVSIILSVLGIVLALKEPLVLDLEMAKKHADKRLVKELNLRDKKISMLEKKLARYVSVAVIVVLVGFFAFAGFVLLFFHDEPIYSYVPDDSQHSYDRDVKYLPEPRVEELENMKRAKSNDAPYLRTPWLVTTGVTNITATTATVRGRIIDAGIPAYTERGVLYTTSANPSVDDAGTKIAVAGSGIGSFTVALEGLTSNTTYYARVYATNENGTTYGNEITFATDEDLPPSIVMTTKPRNDRSFQLAGTGTVTIDWGDGTVKKYTLTSNFSDFNHIYSSASARTITIIGENITHFNCFFYELSNLDVSNNPALIELYADANQLTELDLSKSTALKWLNVRNNQLTKLDVSNNPAMVLLYASDNQLTKLDVSNNPALEVLYASDNQLTSLDVSNNTELWYLNCHNNLLEAESGLNELFKTLHGNAGIKEIKMGGNPGSAACDRSIATSKGWTVAD